MKLSELCEMNRGRVISKDYLRQHSGEYPVYSSQTDNDGVFGMIDTYDYDCECLTWTTDGANAGEIFHRKGKFSITNVCGMLRVNESAINLRFLFHWLKKKAKEYVSEGMGNRKLMSNVMSMITVPIPPFKEQIKIAAILDKFDALVNDLTQGLPAELEARRKQYAYYRDKLLSFKHQN